LGVKLPREYREFVLAYGSGLFAGFYRVYNPFAESPYLNLASSIQRICAMNREIQLSDLNHKRFPLPYFPPAGGLLPWGNDENGNDYYWLTSGPSSRWCVVQQENRGTGIKVHPYSMVEFLIAILQKKVKALASGYPRRECFKFEPFSD